MIKYEFLTLAEKHLRKALVIKQSKLDGKSIELSDTLDNLAFLNALQSNGSAAKSLYENSLKIRQGFYGDNHIKVVPSLINLGAIQISLKEYEPAKTLLEQVTN